MTGFEPAASCSQSRRATNCATPGYFVILSGWSYSPKPGAIPTSLYPDIQFLPLYHGEGENQRFFCLWSFMWSKPLLCRFRQPEENPLSPVLQGFAAFRPDPSRIPPRHSQRRLNLVLHVHELHWTLSTPGNLLSGALFSAVSTSSGGGCGQTCGRMKTLPWNAADLPRPGSVWIVTLVLRKVK